MSATAALRWFKLPVFQNYGLVILSVTAALGLGRLLPVKFGFEPFSLFLCAILLSATIGGVKPGLLAVALSLLAFDHWFTPPGDFLAHGQDISRLVAAALTAFFVVALSSRQSIAARRLRAGGRSGYPVESFGSKIENEDHKVTEIASRAMIDAIPQQIWSGPPDGTLDYCNLRWRQDLGLELDELQGDGWQAMLHPDDRARVVKAWRESVEDGTNYEQEERHRRADGSYRWYLCRGVPQRDLAGQIVRWYGTNTDIEDQKTAEDALRQSEQQLHALVCRLNAVREDEAKRIAREIHDDLGAKLTILKMDLHWLERKLGELDHRAGNPLLDRAVAASELANESILTVQRLARQLRPDVLDKLGLVAAFQFAVREFREHTGINCTVHIPDEELGATAEQSTALFRILQECLTNVMRHAQATRADVQLGIADRHLFMRVQDNGRGIDPAAVSNLHSLGLLGMRERMLLLSGEVSIERAAEGGTVVTVRVPRHSGGKE